MRILIATATAGGGHLQAAAALEEAWHAWRPQDAIKRVDTLEFTPRLYKKAYAEGYVKIAEKIPELYAHAFRKTDDAQLVAKWTKLRRLSAKLITGKFLKRVRVFAPDAVLCPHFLPLEAMGAWRPSPRGEEKPLVACIVTDFEAHALWMEPGIDLYFVAAQETKARLVARGINPRKIFVTGIPVSQRFLKPIDGTAIKRRYKLNPRAPVLLVLGGGMGMGPLVDTVRQIDRATPPLQLIVVAGRNKKLRKSLLRQKFRHAVRVIGFADNMEELMAASDLLVTKPGGLTTSEALAVGKPLLIVNPLPGQEAANSDYLLERGAAVKINRLEDLPYRIQTLLGSKRLPQLARAARALGHPNAALAICKAVGKRLADAR